MSRTNHSTTQPAPRIVYTSPCGLLVVKRLEAKDYSYSIDDQVKGYTLTAHEAEAAGHALLCELLEDEAIANADQEAEMAEPVEPTIAELCEQLVQATAEVESYGKYPPCFGIARQWYIGAVAKAAVAERNLEEAEALAAYATEWDTSTEAALAELDAYAARWDESVLVSAQIARLEVA